MASTNDITGDSLTSKANTQAFADNFDRIFRQPKTPTPTVTPTDEDWDNDQESRLDA